MKIPVDQNHLINLSRKLWAAHFPEQPFPPVFKYDFGGEHHNILVGTIDSWEFMFRFSMTEDTLWESKLLNALIKSDCPVLVPQPVHITIDPNAVDPFKNCVLYKPVNGVPLFVHLRQTGPVVQTELGRGIGSFVHWLNHCPIPDNLIPRRNKLNQDMLTKKDLNHWRLSQCGLTSTQVVSILTLLYQSIITPANPGVVHNDLYPQHILVTPDGQLGVIDWAEITFGDPIKDMTFLYEVFAGPEVYQDKYPELTQAAFAAYKPDFLSPNEMKKLIIYSLVGAFAYDDPRDVSHVQDWVNRYLPQLNI